MPVAIANINYISAVGNLWPLANAVPIANQAIHKTPALALLKVQYMGIWMKALGTSPSLKFEWQESPSTIEEEFVTTNEIYSPIIGPPMIVQLGPPPMLYGRIIITGNAGNGADTTAFARVFLQGANA